MLEPTVFDPAEFIDTPEAQAELLDDALASGDAAYVAQALGVVARARGMTGVARDAGLSREKPVQGARGGRQSGARHRAQGDQGTRAAPCRARRRASGDLSQYRQRRRFSLSYTAHPR